MKAVTLSAIHMKQDCITFVLSGLCGSQTLKGFPSGGIDQIACRAYLKTDFPELWCSSNRSGVGPGFPFMKLSKDFRSACEVGTQLSASYLRLRGDWSLLNHQPLTERPLNGFLFAEFVVAQFHTCLAHASDHGSQKQWQQKCTQFPCANRSKEIHEIIFRLSLNFHNYQYSLCVW